MISMERSVSLWQSKNVWGDSYRLVDSKDIWRPRCTVEVGPRLLKILESCWNIEELLKAALRTKAAEHRWRRMKLVKVKDGRRQIQSTQRQLKAVIKTTVLTCEWLIRFEQAETTSRSQMTWCRTVILCDDCVTAANEVPHKHTHTHSLF